MYPLIRDILFQFEPEKVHHFSMSALQLCCRFPWLTRQLFQQFSFQHPALAQNLWGLHFTNPVGLAAGFDKNADYLTELAALGFGFVEIGTVTPKPQPGNEQPRLFRLPADKALINRMGFNNKGVGAAKIKLAAYRYGVQAIPPIIIGGNIGKNKLTPNEDAWEDYVICFKELADFVDYFVVNVSSPNTPGLRVLQEKDALHKILGELQQVNHSLKKPKPLLLKIAPDVTVEQIDTMVELCSYHQLQGLVAANTTISRDNLFTDVQRIQTIGAGGLSGKPLFEKNNQLLQYLKNIVPANMSIVASGGIFTGADALTKMNAGAHLIQVWTGFVYEGPAIAKNICQYLALHSKN